MKSYITLIFDLDGVLIEHDYSNECINLCKKFGIPYEKSLEEEYYGFWCRFNELFNGKIINKAVFMEKFEEFVDYFKLYGIYGSDFFEGFDESGLSTIVKRHDYSVLLNKIKEKGLKIVALSDWFYERQVQVLSELGYLDYFDRVYTFDDWYMKPDIRAIKRVIGSNDPKDYILVGDTLSADIACANKANVDSIWFNEKGKINTTIYKPDYQIDDLQKILEII